MQKVMWLLIVAVAGLLFPATDALAQRRDGGHRSIRCESEAERHAYCRTGTHGRVELRKRLSKAPCIEYETWGADRDGSGIWVRNGCRAEFAVLENRWGRDDDDDRRGGSGGRVVRCKSNDWSYNHCEARNPRRVRVVRKLSDAPCVKNESWGTDRRGIWVDKGCEAEFAIDRGRR
ncbi:MAG: DUF3011 domain-containing protein [Candidatus Binatia bacterium]